MQHDQTVAPDEDEPGFSQDRHVPGEAAEGLRRRRQPAKDLQTLAIRERSERAK